MNDEPRTCDDKISFASREEAEGAATTARWRYGNKQLKVYKCKKCQNWHLASEFDDNEPSP